LAKHLLVLPSKVRSGATTSEIFKNWENNNALHLIVDVTSGANLAVSIYGYDSVSTKGYTLLSGVLAGTTVLKVGPDYTAAANIAQDYLPDAWYITATTSGSTVYSIGASLI